MASDRYEKMRVVLETHYGKKLSRSQVYREVDTLKRKASRGELDDGSRLLAREVEKIFQAEVPKSDATDKQKIEFFDELFQRWKMVQEFSEFTGNGMTASMLDKGLVDWIDDSLHQLDAAANPANPARAS